MDGNQKGVVEPGSSEALACGLAPGSKNVTKMMFGFRQKEDTKIAGEGESETLAHGSKEAVLGGSGGGAGDAGIVGGKSNDGRIEAAQEGFAFQRVEGGEIDPAPGTVASRVEGAARQRPKCVDAAGAVGVKEGARGRLAAVSTEETFEVRRLWQQCLQFGHPSRDPLALIGVEAWRQQLGLGEGSRNIESATVGAAALTVNAAAGGGKPRRHRLIEALLLGRYQ